MAQAPIRSVTAFAAAVRHTYASILQGPGSSPAALGVVPPPPVDWAPFAVNDSHDGPGFKKPVGGHVYGPYLQADKFKTRGLAILDRPGKSHSLFPCITGKAQYLSSEWIHRHQQWVTIQLRRQLDLFPSRNESNDVNSVYRIEAMLGDCTSNGSIDATSPYPNTPGESAAATGGYLLWAAGPDGIFGPG